MKNGIRPNLAHIPLRWMVREVFKAKTGIVFNSLALARIGIDPNSLCPKVKDRRNAISASLSAGPSDFIQRMSKDQIGHDPFEVLTQKETYEELLADSEEERDKRDALAPLNDSLQTSWGWWLLEKLPILHKRAKEGGEHTVWYRSNNGRGRKIPDPEPNQKVKVHWTVKTRLDARYEDGEKYVPFARNFDIENVHWVLD